jgi:Aldehyde dehydrogenase family
MGSAKVVAREFGGRSGDGDIGRRADHGLGDLGHGVEALETVIAQLRAQAGTWSALPILERIRLLEQAIRDCADEADEWARIAVRVEGLSAGSPLAGEPALVGPYLVLRQLRILRDTLTEVTRRGSPQLPGPLRRVGVDGSQLAARVFPRDLSDRLLFPLVTADVWMEPGLEERDLAETMASFYRRPHAGGLALVLGAGNVSSIAPLDALTKLFADGNVVLVKVHPVLDDLRGVWDRAFRAFVEPGFLAFVSGGAEVGQYLCGHPAVESIHLTGSDATHDAIVYGPGPEGLARKARDEPILDKPLTSELGNVSPVIVVPGTWSDGDLRYQAEYVVTQLVNNAGFNCNAARVIVTHAGWPQRERFLAAVRELLSRVPPRPGYYPGALARFETFAAAHPEAERFGTGLDAPPWIFVSGLDPERPGEVCFDQEAFCGAFSEVSLPADDAADFLAGATTFCNERLFGTLNATLIIDPRTARQPAAAQALERAIAELRYGTVAVNHWAAVGFALGNTTWGAYPGHTRQEIGSGTGVVHNGFLFDRPQKSVIRAPFRVWPKPPWFATHRTADRLAGHLVRYEATRSPRDLAAIAWYAVRG